MPVTVYNEDHAQQVENLGEFSKKYTVIQAAGGAVTNDNGEILLIFRKGKWDLPKGKLEGNEPIELCADREVKEETGLNELILRRKLITTYHTYTEKGNSILKETHWFLFDAPGKQNVQPQTEEEIFKVEWVAKDNVRQYDNTYQLIRDVLRSAGF